MFAKPSEITSQAVPSFITKAEPHLFIELDAPLSEFDQANRTIIDRTIAASTTLPTTLAEFAAAWSKVALVLADGVTVETAIARSVAKDVLPQKKGISNKKMPGSIKTLCHLRLVFKGKVGLRVQFWVKDAPEYPGEKNYSPLRLYHTKVEVYPVEGFTPFKYYDSIMFLLRKISPPSTKLLLYVRQKDSRELLDNGAEPTATPLVKVFRRAGWRFLSYREDKKRQPLFRHRLTLET